LDVAVGSVSWCGCARRSHRPRHRPAAGSGVRRDNGKKSLQWSTTESGKKIVFDSEPYAGFWKILGVNLMRVLPIDAML
jgi:hypothetical protein